MKTILLATDFSTNANAAAHYGYQLARQVNANVLLCNAITIPVEALQAGMAGWPADEYDLLAKDSDAELERFKNELEKTDPKNGFKPVIKCISEIGRLIDVIGHITTIGPIDMIVAGNHTGGGFTQLLTGNHVHNLIENIGRPLLLAPVGAEFKPVRKITFATDLEHLDKDLEKIYELITWAKLLNAEILLAHIVSAHYEAAKHQKVLSESLLELSNKANYPHIYYRLIRNNHIEDGLDWLCGHGQVDMLVMIHRPRTLFAGLFESSHTKKMADNLKLPMLVFPD